MNSEIEELLALQSGVVARHQILVLGMDDNDIRRLLRRREWAVVHSGVYVDHTGPSTFLQRAWAGVLLAWPAALSHETAIRIGDGPGRRDGTSTSSTSPWIVTARSGHPSGSSRTGWPTSTRRFNGTSHRHGSGSSTPSST